MINFDFNNNLDVLIFLLILFLQGGKLKIIKALAVICIKI